LINKYSKNANKTIQKDMSTKDKLLQGSIGMTGESAEVMDLIKKIAFQKHKMTSRKRKKIIEELGDVMWYANLIIESIETTWEEILINNNKKLAKRYPKGKFDSLDSMNR